MAENNPDLNITSKILKSKFAIEVQLLQLLNAVVIVNDMKWVIEEVTVDKMFMSLQKR